MEIFWEMYEWIGDEDDKWKNKDRNVFNYIVKYLINTPIMMPSG